MEYQELFKALKEAFYTNNQEVTFKGVKIAKQQFSSVGFQVLPGKDKYVCNHHQAAFEELPLTTTHAAQFLDAADVDIIENRRFPYYIVVPDSNPAYNKALLLLHGLNEKSWDKYLPWAWRLASALARPVILFPIAFHMERAPASWSDSRLMREFTKERQLRYPDCSNLSFINTAISYRLTMQPNRLFWSGLQTYIDIIAFLNRIKRGQVPYLKTEASTDLFGYSIGAFLSIILLMADPKGHFGASKLFAFCGGTTLDRTYTISKYILDSKASISLSSYFSEELYNGFHSNPRLEHYMNEHIKEGHFKYMINHNYYKKEREYAFKQIADRVLAVPLIKDTVVHPVEVINTLKGDFRDIPIRVEPMDFEFPYDHEHPFSLMGKYSRQVSNGFESVIQKATDFLY